MKHRLVQTESGDWYVVPADRAEEFLLTEWETASAPDWATPLDSPEDITFGSFKLIIPPIVVLTDQTFCPDRLVPAQPVRRKTAVPAVPDSTRSN